MIYLTNLNLNQNELQNAVLQPLATAPSNPRLGQIYCNSITKKIMMFNGSEWDPVGGGTSPSGSVSWDDITSKPELMHGGTYSAEGINSVATLRQTIAADANLKAGEMYTGRFTTTDGKEYDYGFYVTVAKEGDNEVIAPIMLNEKEGRVLLCYARLNATEETIYDITPTKADWNQTDPAMNDFIKNKPTLLSQFSNDTEFITKAVSDLENYYSKTQVDSKIAAISSLKIQKVDVLPETDISTTTIYLVPKSTPATTEGEGETPSETPEETLTKDIYEEFIYVDGNWETIGTTQINLEGYVKSEDLAEVATSGDYNDLNNKPTLVQKGEATLLTTETSKVITVGATETILMISIMDSVTFEEVLCDIEYATVDRHSATISVADAPTNDLKIVYAYI